MKVFGKKTLTIDCSRELVDDSKLRSNIFYGIDTINVNQKWFDNNESILKETKMNEGHSMYDELYDLSEIHLSSTEEEDFTEKQKLEEEIDSENFGKW